MPGGNSSSSKRPYRMLKDGSMNSPDVKALGGAEFLADPDYSGYLLKEPPPGADYIDTNYGLNKYTGIPDNQEDTQGNSGWTKQATESPLSSTSGRDNYV